MVTKEPWTYAKRCLVQGHLFRLCLFFFFRFLSSCRAGGGKVLFWGDTALDSSGFLRPVLVFSSECSGSLFKVGDQAVVRGGVQSCWWVVTVG